MRPLALALPSTQAPLEDDTRGRPLIPARPIWFMLACVTVVVVAIPGLYLIGNNWSGWDSFYATLLILSAFFFGREFYIRAPEEMARTLAEIRIHTTGRQGRERKPKRRVAKIHPWTLWYYGGPERALKLLADWSSRDLVLGQRRLIEGSDVNDHPDGKLLAIYIASDFTGQGATPDPNLFRDGSFVDVDADADADASAM